MRMCFGVEIDVKNDYVGRQLPAFRTKHVALHRVFPRGWSIGAVRGRDMQVFREVCGVIEVMVEKLLK